VICKNVLAAIFRHLLEPSLVRDKAEESVLQRLAKGVIVETVHSLLEIQRTAIAGAVDDRNCSSKTGLIMTIAIPPEPLWREYEP
jgi:hypothetical protein